MTDIQSGFSKSYAQARQKFLSAAQAAGLTVDSNIHPVKGRDGEELAMDVVFDGAPDAQRLLVISSACHGVEGYCGSGVQVFATHDEHWRQHDVEQRLIVVKQRIGARFAVAQACVENPVVAIRPGIEQLQPTIEISGRLQPRDAKLPHMLVRALPLLHIAHRCDRPPEHFHRKQIRKRSALQIHIRIEIEHPCVAICEEIGQPEPQIGAMGQM